jgi:hypothetical protein
MVFVLAPAAFAGCETVLIFGPAAGLKSAQVMNFDRRPIDLIGRLRTPLRVEDCEGDLYVISWRGEPALVFKREVATNVEVLLPVCPESQINRPSDVFDRSSQGAAGGMICRQKRRSAD